MDDVTDLLQLGEEVRRMQLHLASIVESAGDLIISTDRDRRDHDLEHGSAKQRPATRQTECAATNSLNMIDEPQNQEVAKPAFVGIAEIDDRPSVEWPMRCRDGRKHSGVLAPVANDRPAAAKLTGVVVVGRNLVEQRAMEAQMHQGEKLAALGMVIGGIAHEIRNPLGVSSAAAQLMKRCS